MRAARELAFSLVPNPCSISTRSRCVSKNEHLTTSGSESPASVFKCASKLETKASYREISAM
eukprot:2151690-Pyramimonas_sp.AAC.1